MNNPNSREFHYRWEWSLQSTPEQFWPYITDTNRFNRDSGVPPIALQSTAGIQLPNAAHRLRLYRFGIRVDFDEEPFEWIYPTRFSVKRRYLNGPVAMMQVLAQLQPRPDGDTKFTYEVWAQPRNALGLLAIPLQIGWLSRRAFDATVRQYDRLAASQSAPLLSTNAASFPTGGRERLAALSKTLIEQGAAPELVTHLSEFITQADEFALARMRPYQLADRWGTPRRTMLELFLWATRIGLLNFQWDILCPLCRGAKQSSNSLGRIPTEAHCDTCNIDFTANFERSVELTFHPNPAVRHYETLDFCMAGPQMTPHIVTQQLLPPGAERDVQVALEAGRHRLRTLALPGGQALLAALQGAAALTVAADGDGWPNDEPELALGATLRLENHTANEQLFILERTAWSDQAATAADVTALQVFRDLFANEALRPGQQFSVGSLTILFTDLRGSTNMYREVGDATAFGYVMNHFDVLKRAIADESGAIVKTIGDAVMGVFRSPAAALRAILRAQRELAAPTDGRPALALKAGIHYGPCVAVTLNERLDYFGTTVNIAARLEGLSAGGDTVVISSVVHDDPEVQAVLSDPANPINVKETFETTLKGFGAEKFKLYHISVKSSENEKASQINT